MEFAIPECPGHKKTILGCRIEFGQLTKLRNDFIKVVKVTCNEIGIHWMLIILAVIECVQLTDDVFKNFISCLLYTSDAADE